MLFLLLCCNGEKENPSQLGEPVSLIDYVDPFIATGGIGYGVNCGYPGVGRPFGMVKISPDSAMEGGAADGFYRGGGYHYDDVTIQGFSHMHLYATGLTDYGVLAVMPTNGMTPDKTTRKGYGEPFSHNTEWASPGRYAVDLPAAHVELSATAHTALHEYQFTPDSQPTVLIDVGHSMGRGAVKQGSIEISEDGKNFYGTLIMDGEMSKPFPIFFYGEFETPAISWGIWEGTELYENQQSGAQENEDVELGAWLNFAANSTVRLRVALSNVDMPGAQNNFASEHGGFDIDIAQQEAKTDWQEWLSVIQIWGGSDDERSIFATALYHALQMPTLFSDADGRYRGFDEAIHNDGRPFYSDFSLWDTYRTIHPLYTLLWPDAHSDLLWSLAQMSLQGGGLPRWPLANQDAGVMIGTSINIVFPEALRKGITNFKEDELYQFATDAMMQRTSLEFGATPDLETYEQLGYWPFDEVGRSVAWTQEQSIADYALGMLAIENGDTTDGEHLLARSSNWKNLWDEEIQFFHGRNRNGTFAELESESAWVDDFTEGNARQYLWLTPHDPSGLFETLGGNSITLERLTELFEEMEDEDGEFPGLPERWYWHGNEPTLHVPWLFSLAGDKETGDEWIDWLRKNRYAADPVGLAGNDDGGTLSAWYIFASLGFYPISGTTTYVLGEPIWDRSQIIINDQNITIDRIIHTQNKIELDGESWISPTFEHSNFANMVFYVEE
jgi:predicted alpha-1,2-mannosidase